MERTPSASLHNKSGQITGGSCDPQNCSAFLWDPTATAMVDLNELAAEGSDHRLILESWIKEVDDTVGQAVETKTGDLHVFPLPIRGG